MKTKGKEAEKKKRKEEKKVMPGIELGPPTRKPKLYH